MPRSLRACAVASLCAAIGWTSMSHATPVAARPVRVVEQPAQVAVRRGYRANADVAMRVYVPSGRVRIVAWDRDSIDINGTIGAHVTFFGGGGGSHAKMGVENRNAKDTTLANADITVSVPRKARLWVKLTSGVIEATGVTGELELYAVGGSIAVSRGEGVLSVESIDAPVTVTGFSGALRVRNGKGRVRLSGISGTTSVASVSGGVEVSGAVAPDARVETIGGSIDINVKRFGGATLDLQTHAGDITIASDKSRMPAFNLVSRGGTVPKPIPTGNAKEGRVTARSFKGAINVRMLSGIEGTR